MPKDDRTDFGSTLDFRQPQHSCRRFLFFCVNERFSMAFCLLVYQPCDVGTRKICLLLLHHILFCKIDIRKDYIHKTFACKYFSKKICTIVMAQELWRHCVWFLGKIDVFMPEFASILLLLFFLSGHRHLLINIHVVQFQHKFEFARTHVFQFVQTFQDTI